MNLSLIQELYDQGLCCFADSFDNWQDATRFACKPLIDKKYIDEEFVNGIFRNVEKNGLYIFVAPHICMPHCGEYEYVHKKGLCFMKCNTPVIGDPSEPDMAAELFFVVAAEDEGEHMESIQRLAIMLDDEEILNALLSVKCKDDLAILLDANKQQLSSSIQ